MPADTGCSLGNRGKQEVNGTSSTETEITVFMGNIKELKKCYISINYLYKLWSAKSWPKYFLIKGENIDRYKKMFHNKIIVKRQK